MENKKIKNKKQKALTSKCPYCGKVNVIIHDMINISDLSVLCDHFNMWSGNYTYYSAEV